MISPGVVVSRGALVRDSIILTDTVIAEGATVDRAIIDKRVVVGENAQVGVGDDNTPNRREPARINTGLTLIGKGSRIPANARIGRNCVIGVGRTPKDFADLVVPSGETI